MKCISSSASSILVNDFTGVFLQVFGPIAMTKVLRLMVQFGSFLISITSTSLVERMKLFVVNNAEELDDIALSLKKFSFSSVKICL